MNAKPRKVRTMFDDPAVRAHTDGVPVGRRADVLATQKDHDLLAWHSRGNGIGQGCDLYRYPSRAALVWAWRAQESKRLVMQPPTIIPVVKVGGER